MRYERFPKDDAIFGQVVSVVNRFPRNAIIGFILDCEYKSTQEISVELKEFLGRSKYPIYHSKIEPYLDRALNLGFVDNRIEYHGNKIHPDFSYMLTESGEDVCRSVSRLIVKKCAEIGISEHDIFGDFKKPAKSDSQIPEISAKMLLLLDDDMIYCPGTLGKHLDIVSIRAKKAVSNLAEAGLVEYDPVPFKGQNVLGKYSELNLTENGRRVTEDIIRPLYEALVPELDTSYIEKEIAVLDDPETARRYAAKCFALYERSGHGRKGSA